MRELACYTVERRDEVTHTRVRVTVQVLEDEPPRPGLVATRALPQQSSVVDTVGELIAFRRTG